MAMDRFFDIGEADSCQTIAPIPDGASDGERLFAHPVYWGGFVLTGL
jgi:CHAT domain-containing protein